MGILVFEMRSLDLIKFLRHILLVIAYLLLLLLQILLVMLTLARYNFLRIRYDIIIVVLASMFHITSLSKLLINAIYFRN